MFVLIMLTTACKVLAIPVGFVGGQVVNCDDGNPATVQALVPTVGCVADSGAQPVILPGAANPGDINLQLGENLTLDFTAATNATDIGINFVDVVSGFGVDGLFYVPDAEFAIGAPRTFTWLDLVSFGIDSVGTFDVEYAVIDASRLLPLNGGVYVATRDTFRITVNAQLPPVISPVPEPASLVLSLVALGIIVCCPRRFAVQRRGQMKFNLVAALLLCGSFSSFATPLAMTFVRSDASSHLGIAVDSVTGEVYQKNGFGPGYGDGNSPTTWTRYETATAFEADSPASVTVGDTNLWGTYMAAHDGSVFARSSMHLSGPFNEPIDARLSKLSGPSGAELTAVDVVGMGGLAIDRFDWGGFSSVNAMSDGVNLYVVGSVEGVNTDDWQISTYDYALNLLSTVTFSIESSPPFNSSQNPGFAFAISNYIFLGDDYTDGQISKRVNASTGLVEYVDFTLTGFEVVDNNDIYINNATYDAFNDTLYVHSANQSSSFFKLSGATLALGLEMPIPEPGTEILCVVAVVGLATARRRTYSASTTGS
ncbi:MAG: hypothetical protein H6977_07075 [Gammaproteobacteria bacterium]|nr:hypothetical protein [Gammaproteobacteria bacterium]